MNYNFTPEQIKDLIPMRNKLLMQILGIPEERMKFVRVISAEVIFRVKIPCSPFDIKGTIQ